MNRLLAKGIPVCLLLLLVAATARGEEGRLVVAAVDISLSVPPDNRVAGIRLIREKVVPNLGPNDAFVVALIGMFKPEVQFKEFFPSVSPELYAPESDYFTWAKKNASLKQTWRNVAKSRENCLAWLDQPSLAVGKDSTTDLWQTLGFLATLLESSQKKEKYLIIISDMINDVGKYKASYLPPNEIISFPPETNVYVLMAYWESFQQWQKSEAAWKMWFSKAGVKSIQFFDPASSQMLQELLPRSPVKEKMEFKKGE